MSDDAIRWNRRNMLGALAAAGVAGLGAAKANAAAAAAPRTDIKITRVRIFNPPAFKTLAGPMGLAETVVAVDTDAGITGYGQGGTPDLLRYAASLLIGEDPARIEHHWQRMYRSSIYPAGRERLHAIGALDCALWDIRGKLLGQPLYQLLGGRTRDHVECYRSFGGLSVDRAREIGSQTMAEGYRAVRFHTVTGLGTVFDGRRAIGEMMRVCEQLRAGVGPTGEFIIDAHTRFSLADAVQLCLRVAPLSPLCVEDPLRIMDDVTGFGVLRQQVAVPLAAGEQFGDLRDANLQLVEQQLIDFLRTTIPNAGGVTAFGKLAALCEAHGVAMVPHFTAPIATAAVIHALFAFPGQAMNEVLRPQIPPYLREAYLLREGKMFRSELPGLGVVVDESQLNAVATISEARPAELYQGDEVKRPDGSHLYL
ncbi:MAG: mandelate racemase/muconate lactonizing enzyme family protein [Nevskiaceae bacterium]|jgi:L-alanine-DL-glutamate epimerase-like enolase superfamily enzyme|nr:mandelate racemase/muconate lactonizing enzyme family protein [Nevskiaceae bacterium]